MKTSKTLVEILFLVNLFIEGCNEENFKLAEKRREMYKQGTSLPAWIKGREWKDDDFKMKQRDVYLGIVFYGRYNFSDDSSDSRFVDSEEAKELLMTYGWLKN